MKKALLFLNGMPPAQLPQNLADYQIIACTDGAYSNYLMQTAITVDYIIGDLDSLTVSPADIEIIPTPDQNKTDFEKALLFLMAQDIHHVDIYGATGKASDHFLGNLSTGLQYHSQLSLNFYDDYNCLFFADKQQLKLEHVKDKIISLLPFPVAKSVSLQGFVYPLTNTDLTFGQFISLRNQAKEDTVEISFESGNLLICINQ
ncbi:thiamine diphosphokinase [Utexia brackfieldae]|uniref:thiamine diphosphokinase n=1 Tax=Utexia brackfieldae TaxID=3074108 RepID=UPI00370D5452